ncbi:MAG: hypothetical protein ACLFQX_00600 [Candidatus Kapaibacterium sp.]
MEKIILVVILLMTTIGCYAQEKQVPFDSRGEIMTLDSDVEIYLHLFDEYDNFRKARLYQVGDSLYSLEIIYSESGDIMRARREIGPGGRDSLRSIVDMAIVERNYVPGQSDGKGHLLLSSALLSLGVYGWTVAGSMSRSVGSFLPMYTIVSASGVGITYLLIKDENVTMPMAKMYASGGFLGAIHGAELALILFPEGYDASGPLMTVAAFSVAESIVGYNIAKNNNLTEGTVSIITSMGLAGTAYGLGMPDLLLKEDYDNNLPALGIAMLSGSALGYAAGYFMSRDTKYTEGDAFFVTNASMAGALTGLAVAGLTDASHRGYILSAILGSAAGITGGHYLIKDCDFNNTQGVVNLLATGFGGLVGLGMASGFFKGDSADPVWICTTIGALGGYTLSYLGYRDQALVSDDQVKLELQTNPAALGWQPHPSDPRPMEAVRLSVRF